MKQHTLVVIVADPDVEELTMDEAVTRYHRQFSIDEIKGTYYCGDTLEIPIGEDSGQKTGIIGVYDTNNAEHVKKMENKIDSFDLKW